MRSWASGRAAALNVVLVGARAAALAIAVAITLFASAAFAADDGPANPSIYRYISLNLDRHDRTPRTGRNDSP